MLKARKARVVASLTYETFVIRQLELAYWLDVFKKFGVLAAFLGGFASSVSLLNTATSSSSSLAGGKGREHRDRHLAVEEEESRELGGGEGGGFSVLFVLTAGGAMGFNLVLLIISVVCCLYAPGKALTGRGESSYQTVIRVLEEMYTHCLILFRLGLVCYLLASIFAVFRLFCFFSACMITVVFLAFGYFLTLRASRLREKFIPQTYTTGHLQGRPVEDIGESLTARHDPALTGLAMDSSFGCRI